MNEYKFCMSSYLTFRYVVKRNIAWAPGIIPSWPNTSCSPTGVSSVDEIDNFLNAYLSQETTKRTGLLLSSGIDSAILAKYLAKKTPTYTIRFCAPNAIDESEKALHFARLCDHQHKVINVYWSDYKDYAHILMKHKQSPLHAIEVGLYKAALQAKEDGVECLIVGNGADSTFGGMDKLLSKDWKFNEFIERYSFVNADITLKSPVDMTYEYAKYKTGNGIDVQSFLKNTHGTGIVQAFENAIHCAGCEISAPFESMYLDEPLDISRIRSGESKYYLRQLFQKLYPSEKRIPDKIPFARPMDQWLDAWKGPQNDDFRNDIDLNRLSGDQKWLLYCLDLFLRDIVCQ